jgi:hypothetical protein
VGFLFGEDKEKAGKIGDGSDVMEHLRMIDLYPRLFKGLGDALIGGIQILIRIQRHLHKHPTFTFLPFRFHGKLITLKGFKVNGVAKEEEDSPVGQLLLALDGWPLGKVRLAGLKTLPTEDEEGRVGKGCNNEVRHKG